jgi:hypothetical protein
MVTGGLIAYPFNQARELLRFFRDPHGLASYPASLGSNNCPEKAGVRSATATATGDNDAMRYH